MNNITLIDVASQTQLSADYPKYVALLAIALIVVVVLLALVIINQSNKIKKMSRPKYGFLGKPLYAFGLIAFTFGTFGLIFYSANKPVDVQQTSADRRIDITIKAFALGANTNNYSISITPLIDGNLWGGNNNYKFDVYWTIVNSNGVISDAELGLNLYKQGGIFKKLPIGKNTIKATIFFNNKTYEKQIDLNL